MKNIFTSDLRTIIKTYLANDINCQSSSSKIDVVPFYEENKLKLNIGLMRFNNSVSIKWYNDIPIKELISQTSLVDIAYLINEYQELYESIKPKLSHLIRTANVDDVELFCIHLNLNEEKFEFLMSLRKSPKFFDLLRCSYVKLYNPEKDLAILSGILSNKSFLLSRHHMKKFSITETDFINVVKNIPPVVYNPSHWANRPFGTYRFKHLVSRQNFYDCLPYLELSIDDYMEILQDRTLPMSKRKLYFSKCLSCCKNSLVRLLSIQVSEFILNERDIHSICYNNSKETIEELLNVILLTEEDSNLFKLYYKNFDHYNRIFNSLDIESLALIFDFSLSRLHFNDIEFENFLSKCYNHFPMKRFIRIIANSEMVDLELFYGCYKLFSIENKSVDLIDLPIFKELCGKKFGGINSWQFFENLGNVFIKYTGYWRILFNNESLNIFTTPLHIVKMFSSLNKIAKFSEDELYYNLLMVKIGSKDYKDLFKLFDPKYFIFQLCEMKHLPSSFFEEYKHLFHLACWNVLTTNDSIAKSFIINELI